MNLPPVFLQTLPALRLARRWGRPPRADATLRIEQVVYTRVNLRNPGAVGTDAEWLGGEGWGVTTENIYSVVLTGKLVGGREPSVVLASLARLFKTTTSNMQEVLEKAPVKIKKEIDRATALKYKAAVEQAGAFCQLEIVRASSDDRASAPGFLSASDGTESPALHRLAAGVLSDTRDAANDAAPGVTASAEDIYAPPQASLEEPELDLDPLQLRNEPRRVGAGRGWSWIAEGFGSFKQRPLVWIGVFLAWMLMILAMSIVPLGTIGVYVLQPIFLGGLMLGCFSQDQGDDFEFRHLFAGFSHETAKLAAAGGIYLGAFFALGLATVLVGVVLVFAVGGGLEMLEGLVEGGDELPADAAGPLITVILVVACLFATGSFVVVMGLWFAPALIALHQIEVMEAIKLSFQGCLRNWIAFLIYGLVLLVLMVLAMLPLFLGLLVLGPVFTASLYWSYKDIYVR